MPLDRVFQAVLDSACTFCHDRNLTSVVKGEDLVNGVTGCLRLLVLDL